MALGRAQPCLRAALGSTGMQEILTPLRRHLTTLRVAGVPEHFNAPFHLAKERGLYEKSGVNFEWACVPQGTGAMAEQLEAGKVDVAVMLSEGATAKMALGAPFKAVGTYVSSPLRWGIHVGSGRNELRSPEDLKGKVFGVSRLFSGSHLMAHVFASQRGWNLAADAPIKVVGSLEDAREAMAQRNIDAWLWEKFTTKHLVDSGEWKILGEVLTPWPCFLFIASDQALAKHGQEIQRVVEVTNGVCAEFKANQNGSTVEYVAKHHAMSQADAAEWLEGTEWSCATEVHRKTLESTQQALLTIGVLKEAVDPSKLVAEGLCKLRD